MLKSLSHKPWRKANYHTEWISAQLSPIRSLFPSVHLLIADVSQVWMETFRSSRSFALAGFMQLWAETNASDICLCAQVKCQASEYNSTWKNRQCWNPTFQMIDDDDDGGDDDDDGRAASLQSGNQTWFTHRTWSACSWAATQRWMSGKNRTNHSP